MIIMLQVYGFYEPVKPYKYWNRDAVLDIVLRQWNCSENFNRKEILQNFVKIAIVF